MIKLFLLNPGFTDPKMDSSGRKFYCPFCARIEGVLSYYPCVRDELDVVYVDFPRPRKVIVDLLGEENQGCPLLVITKDEGENLDLSAFKTHSDYLFANNVSDIASFFAEKYGIGMPHP